MIGLCLIRAMWEGGRIDASELAYLCRLLNRWHEWEVAL